MSCNCSNDVHKGGFFFTEDGLRKCHGAGDGLPDVGRSSVGKIFTVGDSKRYILSVVGILGIVASSCFSETNRWLPVQKVPKGVVKAIDYDQLAESPNGKSTQGPIGATHILVQSLAGLAAQAVNDGYGDEMVWIDVETQDYQQWYAAVMKRLDFEQRGSFTPWQLVERFKLKGIVKGYVLYSYDYSEPHTRFTEKDLSVNVATVIASFMGGILAEEGQEEQAKAAGLKILFDARGKNPLWCFEQFKDRLNRNTVALINPKIANNRDFAIAYRCMVAYGLNSPTPQILEWLNPGSPIIGWITGDEFTHTSLVTSWGHFHTASDWAMNLPLMMAGTENYEVNPKIRPFDPSVIKYDDTGHFTSFVLSDGDNLQWMLGRFSCSEDYWASPVKGAFPYGWTSCISVLAEAAPQEIEFLSRSKPDNSTIINFPGYFYPDLFAQKRPDREKLLKEHAARIGKTMKQSGSNIMVFICKDVNSAESLKACKIFAEEIDGLIGMIIFQYHPYEGGNGEIIWVENKNNIEIPVVTAKFSIWSHAGKDRTRCGTPAKVARQINEITSQPLSQAKSDFSVVAQHSWSRFKRIADANETGEELEADQKGLAGPAVTQLCIERLNEQVKVVSPEELIWRIRMQHNPQQTKEILVEMKKENSRKTNLPAKSSNVTDVWVVNALRFSEAEKVMLATLQGLTSKGGEVIWVNSGGMDGRILKQLQIEGVKIHEIDSSWEVLSHFSGVCKGFVLYKLGTDSINVATSLCGPYKAVAVDESLQNQVQSFGLNMLIDVRGCDEAAAFEKYGRLCSDAIMIEQDWRKYMYLRDFAVANNAFVFWDPHNNFHSKFLRQLGPGGLVYGYGSDELGWVKDLSRSGVAGIPADWSLNLSVQLRFPVEIPDRPHKYPEPAQDGQRIVAFVMSDGDNIQWLMGGFVNSPGFWASRHRGTFNMTWEVAPILAEVAPRVLRYFYTTASNGNFLDDFVVSSSGLGYCFPHYLPDRKAFVEKTIPYMQKSRLSIVSILNTDGDMSDSKEYLDRPEVLGVLYKDFVPYNKERGRIYWHNGKPCASYRFLLWDNADENRPEGLAKAIGAMPVLPTKDPNSYALINVHAWSFGNIGGPMEAIKKTIDQLPPNTRVVTAEQFITLLRNNFGTPVQNAGKTSD